MGKNKERTTNTAPLDNQVLLYQTEAGRQRFEVKLEDETDWLSQKQLAELFQVKVYTIDYLPFQINLQTR